MNKSRFCITGLRLIPIPKSIATYKLYAGICRDIVILCPVKKRAALNNWDKIDNCSNTFLNGYKKTGF
jgi:hypothetical protein